MQQIQKGRKLYTSCPLHKFKRQRPERGRADQLYAGMKLSDPADIYSIINFPVFQDTKSRKLLIETMVLNGARRICNRNQG